MRPYGWLHKIRFDQNMLDAYRSPIPQLAMANLASTSVLAPELVRSEAAAAAALQIERSQQQELEAAAPARSTRASSRPGEKCSLCSSSAEHTYRAPDYVCSAAIQRACPAMLTDGKRCGERHAHSGPRKTPCRGGLEHEGRQRLRGGGSSAAGAPLVQQKLTRGAPSASSRLAVQGFSLRYSQRPSPRAYLGEVKTQRWGDRASGWRCDEERVRGGGVSSSSLRSCSTSSAPCSRSTR